MRRSIAICPVCVSASATGPSKIFVAGFASGRPVCEPRVEALERGEEARDLAVPRERHGVVPHGFPVRHRERPVEEIAHVREDLDRRAPALAGAEVAEARRRVAHGLARAVRERRDRVAEHRKVGVGRAHALTFRTILPKPSPDAIRS